MVLNCNADCKAFDRMETHSAGDSHDIMQGPLVSSASGFARLSLFLVLTLYVSMCLACSSHRLLTFVDCYVVEKIIESVPQLVMNPFSALLFQF